MQQYKRRIFPAMIIGFIGIMLLARIRLAPPPAYDLLERATKVTNYQSGDGYNWFTSDEVFMQRANQVGEHDGRQTWAGYFELINARTGKHTRLEALSKVVRDNCGSYDSTFGPMGFTQSPDGRWLLSEYLLVPGHPQPVPVTVHLDGSGYHEWTTDDDHNWIDGHRWASFFYAPTRDSEDYTPDKLILHDAEHPEADRLVPVKSPEAQTIDHHPTVPPSTHQNAELISYPLTTTKSSDVEMKIYRIPLGVRRVKHLAPDAIITLPPGATRYSLSEFNDTPNPQNTRIAYLFHETGIPEYVTFLRRFDPKLPYKEHPVVCLCVYRTDTKKFVEIGRIDERGTGPYLLDLAWLPDGKHIRFYYNHAIYRVSTD